jgi:hypothetical protein
MTSWRELAGAASNTAARIERVDSQPEERSSAIPGSSWAMFSQAVHVEAGDASAHAADASKEKDSSSKNNFTVRFLSGRSRKGLLARYGMWFQIGIYHSRRTRALVSAPLRLGAMRTWNSLLREETSYVDYLAAQLGWHRSRFRIVV